MAISDEHYYSDGMRELRVLALMEASSVTGPAKNLIEFAIRAGRPLCGLPPVKLAVAAYQRGGGAPSEFVSAARKAGLEVFVLAERRRFDLRPVVKLREVVAAFRPDILQSHNTKSHFFIRLSKLYRRYPWVAFNHGYTATDLKDHLYNQFDRWSLRAAHRVVTVCRPFAKRLEGFGVAPERIRIQHNSVKPFIPPEPEVVEQVRQQLGLGLERVILAVGRLSREKGHAGLLRAFSLLMRRDAFRGCRLLIVGTGPERERLLRLSGRLGLSGIVTLAGHQVDMRPFYALAALLVLPSNSEGSPNVVLEAMAAGVPVLATAVGGVTEILEQDRTGLLVPARDAAAMSSAIERLMEDETLRRRLSDAARLRAAADFTPEAHCRLLLSLYCEALSTFPPYRPPVRPN